jgi:hypothetical protein
MRRRRRAEKKRRKQPTGPQLNRESQRSHENEEGASYYFLKAISQFEARSVHDELDPLTRKQIVYAMRHFRKLARSDGEDLSARKKSAC